MNLSTHIAPNAPAAGVGSRYLKGSTFYPLTERMADSIAVHGLAYCVRYYTKRLPLAEARVLLASAYSRSAVRTPGAAS
jgi:hypothetical protein